jgi:rhamnosyltransferase subunit B
VDPREGSQTDTVVLNAPFFSLRTPPRAAAPARAGQIWMAYRQLDRSQWLSPAELERLQLAKVRLLLKHCAQNVPYYQRELAEAGVAPEDVRTMEDFRRIPLLSRRTYQEQFADFHAAALPAGTVPTGRSSTSGTSGVAIEVEQTSTTDLWWWALYLRDLEWNRIDPRGVQAVIRPTQRRANEEDLQRFREGICASCWAPPLEDWIESGPSHGMDIHQDPRRQLAWLRRVAPAHLVSYPSHLDFLGSLIREEGRALPTLQSIQTISETLMDEVQTRIETAFGVPVRNLYSCGEAGYLASPCPEGGGLHVHAEHVLLEVLDADDRPCLPGQTGRVVLTTLHNYLTPLIRYEIMDEATVGPAACSCGRGLPLLAKVHGKRRPLFRLTGGRVKHSDGLTQQLRWLGGVHQQQIIQKAVDRFLLRVSPGRNWTAEHPERLRRLVQDHVEAPVHVEVEIRDRLEPSAGGKLVDVVSELEGASGEPLANRFGSSQRRAESVGSPRPGTPGRGVGGEGFCLGSHAPSPQPLSPEYRGEGPMEKTLNLNSGRSRSRLATVLLGWELGAGFGHVQRLLRLARALASHGYRPVLVLRNLVEPWPALREASLPILQAPLWQPHAVHRDKPFLAASYADILAVHGYTAVDDLAPMVEAWQGLIEAAQPALVICDHSPTLCLAAYGTVPTVVVGTGFITPPLEEPVFPLLLPGRTPLVPEAELLAVVQEVQRRRGRPAPETLPGLLRGTQRFLTVLPEMDPYQDMRQEPALGPLEDLAPFTPPPVSPNFFAYLSVEAHGIEQILGGLLRSGRPGSVYLRGASPGMRQSLRRPGLEVLDGLGPLAEVLPRASAVVHHAGSGLAQQALAAGRPQLVFPNHLEQVLNAQMLHALGVGQYVLGASSEEIVAQELRQLLAGRALAERALTHAAGLQKRGPWDPLPRIVENCVVLLEQYRLSPFSS